jgi:hypothetical protein
VRDGEKAVARLCGVLSRYIDETVLTSLEVKRARRELRAEFPDATGEGPEVGRCGILALTPTRVLLFNAKHTMFMSVPKPKLLLGSWSRDKVRADVRSRRVPIAASGGWAVAAPDLHAVHLQVRDEGIDIVIEAGVGDAATGPLTRIVQEAAGSGD